MHEKNDIRSFLLKQKKRTKKEYIHFFASPKKWTEERALKPCTWPPRPILLINGMRRGAIYWRKTLRPSGSKCKKGSLA